MKKIITLVLMFICVSTFAQINNAEQQILELGWGFASPLILKKINDPLTKEIITNAIPKIIAEDAKGAALEVINAIYNVKKIKVLNKDFLSLLNNNIDLGIKAIKQKDYATAANELIKAVAFSEEYIKNGSLGQTTTTTPVSTTSVNEQKTDIVTTKEINSKIHIGENNNYLFFITEGSFTQKDTSDKTTKAQMEEFSVTLDDGKKFVMNVAQASSPELKQESIEKIQSDKSEGDQIKNAISNLIAKFGEGKFIKSEVATCPNFKALKYTYMFTDKTTSEYRMANVYVALQDITMFMIIFNTPTNDFVETSKSFDNLMNYFYIIGVDEISNSNTAITNNNKETTSTTNSHSQITKTPVKTEELQKGITENIKKDYPDYKVIKAMKIDTIAKGKTVYEIRIEKTTTGKETIRENLFYDKDGNFLRKITPPAKLIQ